MLSIIENEEDRNFLAEHYIKLYPLLYKLVFEIIQDTSCTEDIIHDGMIRLIGRLDFLQRKDQAVQVSYIVRTVINAAKNWAMADSRRKHYSYISAWEDISDELPDEADPLEEKLYMLCDYENLGHAIERLSERDRDLLYLKYVGELSDKEIAERLGIAVNNIRSYYSRARKRALKQIREVEKADAHT